MSVGWVWEAGSFDGEVGSVKQSTITVPTIAQGHLCMTAYEAPNSFVRVLYGIFYWLG